MSEGQWRAF